MSLKIRIDPEFQNKIPPLTEAEFEQLEENILDAGKVYEPITVWNGTIVDGHNRYKIILAHPYLEWSVREMKFADKWEAFDWMYKNQLGRRNLTDEQKTYLLGKMLEARKHSHGGDRRSEEFSSSHSDTLKDSKQSRVANQIAEEQGVGVATVNRARDYANGIDEIRKAEPEFADAILKAEKKIPKVHVIEVGKADPGERPEMIQELAESGTVRKRSKNESTIEIGNIVDTMSDDSTVGYTVGMMKEQIRLNAEAFIRSLSNLLKDHSDLWARHTEEINGEIDCIISKIRNMKGDIE